MSNGQLCPQIEIRHLILPLVYNTKTKFRLMNTEKFFCTNCFSTNDDMRQSSIQDVVHLADESFLSLMCTNEHLLVITHVEGATSKGRTVLRKYSLTNSYFSLILAFLSPNLTLQVRKDISNLKKKLYRAAPSKSDDLQ